MNAEQLIKRYGDRKPFEWFMRAEDQRYWDLTKKRIKKTEKKMTALVAASTVISIAVAVTSSQRCKFR